MAATIRNWGGRQGHVDFPIAEAPDPVSFRPILIIFPVFGCLSILVSFCPRSARRSVSLDPPFNHAFIRSLSARQRIFPMNAPPRKRRPGFTLVELLVSS
jgi:hypothetical protein